MSSESIHRSPKGDKRLVQLVYRSTSTTGVTSALQMSDILAVARPRNAELRITGVLTAVSGKFVQIIEGPEVGIDRLMAKLVRDRRHVDLRVLERRVVKARAFAEWDMVSPKLAGLEIDRIASLLADKDSDLDAFIPVFKQAIIRQDGVLEGTESPVDSANLSGPGDPFAPSVVGDLDA